VGLVDQESVDRQGRPAPELNRGDGVQDLQRVCWNEVAVVAGALCDHVGARDGVGVGRALLAARGARGARVRGEGGRGALGAGAGLLLGESAGAAGLARESRGGAHDGRGGARCTKGAHRGAPLRVGADPALLDDDFGARAGADDHGFAEVLRGELLVQRALLDGGVLGGVQDLHLHVDLGASDGE